VYLQATSGNHLGTYFYGNGASQNGEYSVTTGTNNYGGAIFGYNSTKVSRKATPLPSFSFFFPFLKPLGH
jgi:hypothetical protein